MVKLRLPSRKSFASNWVTIAVAITLIFSAYSLFTVLTLKPGQTAVIPPGITVEKPAVEISSVNVNEEGDLIVRYSDNTSQNLGKVRADTPTADVISAAVASYCKTNKCDGYPPSQGDVLAAVTQYCANGICRGEGGVAGTNAPPITADQILAQVAAYCSDNNRCRGETGATGTAGANGTNARQPIWACVLTTENNNDVRYYTQKYADEPDSAYLTWEYRSRLPAWFVPNSCIDMRGQA